MKIFSEELVEKAVKELHIANLAQATIGDVLLVAQYLPIDNIHNKNVL